MSTSAELVYTQAAAIAAETISQNVADLRDVNHFIHSHPELNFEEYQAHDAIVSLLEKLNFKVTPHAYGLETSFESEVGEGGRVVVFNAEYDALPDIGHACGHNLIATGSIAAFLSVAAMLKQLKVPGRVRLLGTPAEEGGGGKVALIAKGAYESVDACMMAHPAPLHANYAKEFNGDVYRRQVACESIDVDFTGKNAHAAFAPWQGINALDAVVQSYNNISMLRQQMMPSDRVNGVIKEGGVQSNIIPDHTMLEYTVRTRSLAENAALKQKVLNCFQGAAIATGCEVVVTSGSTYADLIPNQALCSLFTEEMEKLNLPMWCDNGAEEYVTGATDQGNVSYVVPAIHPNYGIPAGIGSFNHTIGFTEAAISDEAFDRTLTVARGMAMCAWRILTDAAIADTIKQEFDAEKATKSPEELDLVKKCGSIASGQKYRLQCQCTHMPV